MKISQEIIDDSNCLVIEDVYSGFIMRTSEGNEISICMRDDTFDINVMPKGQRCQNWWHINMQTGGIKSETTQS